MKPITLGRIFALFAVSITLLSCPSLARASTPVAPSVVPKGDNTFTITQTATNGFNRDVDKLKAEVEAQATKYCADQGKEIKVVELTSKKPFFATGYASATIVFQALTPAELAQAKAAATPGAPAVAIERSISTDELVSELTKLDDLRKKGILTDEEFQVEKKKVLAHSK